MHELQALGVALVELPESQLGAMQIADALREAVLEAKRIKSHEGRRRQLQYIGRLMRDVDPVPLRAQLDALTGHSAQEAARRRRPAGAAHADPQRAPRAEGGPRAARFPRAFPGIESA